MITAYNNLKNKMQKRSKTQELTLVDDKLKEYINTRDTHFFSLKASESCVIMTGINKQNQVIEKMTFIKG